MRSSILTLLVALSLVLSGPAASLAAPTCADDNLLCQCSQNPSLPGCSTIDSSATADYGGTGEIGEALSGLAELLGVEDLASLIQALTPLIELIAEKLSSMDDVTQSNYPVDLDCLGELEVLEWQLGNGTDPTPLSNSCMSQIEELISTEDAEVIKQLFEDDENEADNNETEETNEPDPTDDETVDEDNDENGEEAAACEETDLFNEDCTPKVTINSDRDTITFNNSQYPNSYKKTGEDTYVDTDTGERFTWEEVLERESVPEDMQEKLDSIQDMLVEADPSKPLSIIGNILGAGGLSPATNPATGAPGNILSSLGQMLQSLLGGGNGGPLSSIASMIGNVPGVSNILGGSGAGLPGSGNPGAGSGANSYEAYTPEPPNLSPEEKLTYDEAVKWLATQYKSPDFDKDSRAAMKAGFSKEETVEKFVIGGADPQLVVLLATAGQAMEAEGIDFSFSACFRDNYRQSIATGYPVAPPGGSFHGNTPATAGYGHGLACDINGAGPQQWIDKNGLHYGLVRPYGSFDPPHVALASSPEVLKKKKSHFLPQEFVDGIFDKLVGENNKEIEEETKVEPITDPVAI